WGSIKGSIGDFVDGAEDAFRGFERYVYGIFKSILDHADDALSWIPGLGPKIDKARHDFDKFVDDFNTDVDRMKSSKDFTVGIKVSDPNHVADIVRGGWTLGQGLAKGGIQPAYRAQQGLLAPGGIATAGRRPTIAFAEPGTGREGFVPELG